jgi:hypothetical protein
MVVCVNSISIEAACRRACPLPHGVEWRYAERLPPMLASVVGETMAEGVAWKLAPPRLFPQAHEISLDNDYILWDLPPALEQWLTENDPPCVLAADVRPAFGRFADLTRTEPRNTGLRGLPPHYDLGAALERVLEQHERPLQSELDEQGLQVVAMELDRPVRIVPTEDVTVCSPIWPHQPWLGRAGAHFVGINAKSLPFDYYGRPARDVVADNWARFRPEIEARVGAPNLA